MTDTANLQNLIGEWVRVHNPDAHVAWTGQLTGLADTPSLVLRTGPGETAVLPQDFTVEHLELQPADETDDDHGKPLHCRTCADTYLGTPPPAPPVTLDVRLSAPLTKEQAQRLQRVIQAALDAREDRTAEAEAELARLRAGEEPVTDPYIEHTPGQWLYTWNRLTPEQRLEHAARIMRDCVDASQCFMENHRRRLSEESKAWVRLARVEDVVADMENITGARHWARILHKALSGQDTPEDTTTTDATKSRPSADTITSGQLDDLHNQLDRAQRVAMDVLDDGPITRVHDLANEWRKTGQEPNAWISMEDAATAVLTALAGARLDAQDVTRLLVDRPFRSLRQKPDTAASAPDEPKEQ
ncbi:hypothetical protein [Streptomyces sp. NPDC002845]